MDIKEFIQLLKKKKATFTMIVMLFVIAGLIITLAQPLKYRAKSRLLILQPNNGADAYLVARSNEYMGGLISEVIYSGSFLESLKSSNYAFDRNYFGGTYKESLKKWQKTISAKNSGDTGVINIEIYHTDPEEARKISQAVNELIISGRSPYQFNPLQVKINIIDRPIVSSFPLKPNLPINFSLSLLFGLMAACSYIYVFPKGKAFETIDNEVLSEEKVEPSVAPELPYQPSPVTFIQEEELPVVPENLPIYYPENNNSEAPFHFQGNISNVLGE